MPSNHKATSFHISIGSIFNIALSQLLILQNDLQVAKASNKIKFISTIFQQFSSLAACIVKVYQILKNSFKNLSVSAILGFLHCKRVLHVKSSSISSELVFV